MSARTCCCVRTVAPYPRGDARVRADASVLPRGNLIRDATVRPSHRRPSGHRPVVRVTTLAPHTFLHERLKHDESTQTALHAPGSYCVSLQTSFFYISPEEPSAYIHESSFLAFGIG
jgi:hypothetical protein